MLRNWFILAAAMLLSIVSAGAQCIERVYVSTDRNAYLAGERVGISLFSVDEKGHLSSESAVAYLELISAEGPAVEAKAALLDGRGAGSLTLPASLPTGNYRLVAYTATGNVSLAGSRLLSVYNPYSLRRVSGGVSLPGTYEPVSQQETDSSLLDVSFDGDTLVLQAHQPLTFSLSVSRPDALVQLSLPSIGDFLSAAEPLKAGEAEYDGEVIHGRVFGVREGARAYLSSAGSPSDTYISTVAADGSLRFPTSNIFGDRELVCEVEDGSETSFVVLESPFIHPDAGVIPSLALHLSQEADLLARKRELDAPVRMDTLAQFMPRREDLLFQGTEWEVFDLNDYTRFPTVQEVITEIVTAVRIGRSMGKPAIKVVVPDATKSRKAFRDNILTMMDGVVITDLNLLLNFDAMLLDRVEVCRQPIVIGRTPFNGAVNFVTKNQYVKALAFPDRVRVVDFRGVSYPVSFPYTEGVESPLNTWLPVVEMDAEEVLCIPVGSFKSWEKSTVFIEGMAENGGFFRILREIE